MLDGERFANRRQAGRELAARLAAYRDRDPVVLALPRGGVPVAYEVARALRAPLDIVVVRKLGAPGQPELGIGAVVDGDHPEAVLNDDVLAHVEVPEGYLRREVDRQLREIRRRESTYRRGRSPVAISGRTAIVIDDGLATGGTMRAALRGLRRQRPKRLVLAVPVAAPDSLAALAPEADDVVCLSAPSFFGAVGHFYEEFRQTTDDEVIALLAEAARDLAARPPAPGS